jgi:hypothetical protein
MSSVRGRLMNLHNELVRIDPYPWNDISLWAARAIPIIRHDWPDYFDDFREMVSEPRWTDGPLTLSRVKAENRSIFARDEAKYETIHKEQAQRAKARILEFLKGVMVATASRATSEPLDILLAILDRFHLVARQLRKRHGNRPSLKIADEYDVQDLLHALLKLQFDDVRPEEWTPSCAGACSRMDFLLKDEQIVVEVKKTSESLGAKEIGEQLLADIAKYRQHPDCKMLVCFVYDPDHRIGNAVGLQRDLESESSQEMQVVVCIRPT